MVDINVDTHPGIVDGETNDPVNLLHEIQSEIKRSDVPSLLSHMPALIRTYQKTVTDTDLLPNPQTGKINPNTPSHQISETLTTSLSRIADEGEYSLSPREIMSLYRSFRPGKYHGGTISSQAAFSSRYLGELLMLDEKNRKHNEGINLRYFIKEDLMELLTSPDTEQLADSALASLRHGQQDSLIDEIVLYALIRSPNPEGVIKIVKKYVPQTRLKKLLTTHAIVSPSFQPTVDILLKTEPEDSSRISPPEGSDTLLDQDLEVLSRTPEGEHMISLYTNLLSSLPVIEKTITSVLATFEHKDRALYLIAKNWLTQAQDLLMAPTVLQQTGYVSVTMYGETRVFSHPDQIERELFLMCQKGESLLQTQQAPEEEQAVLHFANQLLYEIDETPEPTNQPHILILGSGSDPATLTSTLLATDIITTDKVSDYQSEDEPFKSTSVATATVGKHPYTPKIITETARPDIIILDLPEPQHLDDYQEAYHRLLDDSLALSPDEQPTVIVNSNGFPISLRFKTAYPGWLFATDTTHTQDLVAVSKKLLALHDKPDDYRPDVLEEHHHQEYDDAVESLDAWVPETTNTYAELKIILGRIQERNALLRAKYSSLFEMGRYGQESFSQAERNSSMPARRTQAVLEIGCGPGRMLIALAQAGLDLNLVGVDISQNLLDEVPKRVVKESQGAQEETADSSLSVTSLKKLHTEGLIPPPLTDPEEIAKHIVTVQGSFYNLENVSETMLREWQERFPDKDLRTFMNDDTGEPFNPAWMHADVGYDYAVMFWNTYCGIGDIANQKEFLEQLLHVLYPGGEFANVFTDRTCEPYAQRLKEYHTSHPNEPYGTLRDTYTDETGERKEYSPRFFPSKEEYIALLKSVGFEINAESDIQTFFVEGNTPEAEKKIKQYVITARKPKE